MVRASFKKKPSITWDLRKVVIYLRVSTREQGDSGLGLAAQESQCLRVAESLGLEVLHTFSEVGTGKKPIFDREISSEAIEFCQTHGARLMVAKLDRLSRNFGDVVSFLEGRTYGQAMTQPVITADSPTASILEIRLKAIISDEERRLISERTIAALNAKREQGWIPGAQGNSAAVTAKRALTSDAYQRMKQLRGEGKGYKAIADTLNAESFTTSKGGRWYAAGVRSRLINEG